MRPLLPAALLASGLAAAALPAQAQGLRCDGRLNVDPVTVTEVPGIEREASRREFAVGLRNMTGQPMLVLVRVGHLPGLPTAGGREAELGANAFQRVVLMRLDRNSTLTASELQGRLAYFCR